MKYLLLVMMFVSSSVFAFSDSDLRMNFVSESENKVSYYTLTENEAGLWNFTIDPNSCRLVNGTFPYVCTEIARTYHFDSELRLDQNSSSNGNKVYLIGDTGYKFIHKALPVTDSGPRTRIIHSYRICDLTEQCKNLTLSLTID